MVEVCMQQKGGMQSRCACCRKEACKAGVPVRVPVSHRRRETEEEMRKTERRFGEMCSVVERRRRCRTSCAFLSSTTQALSCPGFCSLYPPPSLLPLTSPSHLSPLLYSPSPSPPVLSQLPGRKLEVELTMLSSNYHVEMSPGDVGHNDRYVVQAIIKDMARNRPLDATGEGGREGGGRGGGREWGGTPSAPATAHPPVHPLAPPACPPASKTTAPSCSLGQVEFLAPPQPCDNP